MKPLVKPTEITQQAKRKSFEDTFGYEDGQGFSDGCDSLEETPMNEIPSVQVNKSWLQSAKISLSPTEEFLVAAKENKAVFLTKKWDEQPFYEITWNGHLSLASSDIVSCIKCVPLASQQRSSEGTPDWTCIIVGFVSGYIRIYMPNGKQLLSQYLHEGRVINIKLKTKQYFQNVGCTGQLEELLVLYPDAIVTIDGFSMYQSLRACRNQFARAQASSTFNVMSEPPALEYHKWRIESHNKVKDVTQCGTVSQCLFDRLQTVSFINGPRSTVKGSSPAFNCIITTGKSPFLGVYHAIEGNSQPMISDVAIAVANKLTSAVLSQLTAARGWFGVTQQEQTTSHNVKPKVEKGTKLSNTVCLQDSLRHAESITVAPIGYLAVVTDSFNRILLLDTLKSTVVRMWKGYRDAECGWIAVEEEIDDTDNANFNSDNGKRRALFLVIYAPKRGILEIYLMEHGARVSAFNVGKGCRLIYPGYRLLGETIHSAGFKKTNQCFLLEADGVVKSIHVPFHCALNATHSVLAKDAHLLKKLSNIIKQDVGNDDSKEWGKSLITILLEIQIPRTQKQAVQNILASPKPTAECLKICLMKIVENISKKVPHYDEQDIEYEAGRQELLHYCCSQHVLIETFISLQDFERQYEGSDSKFIMEEGQDIAVANLLHVTVTEAQDLFSSIKKYIATCLKKELGKKPCDTQDLDINVATFLSCFEIVVSGNKNNSSLASASSLMRGFVIIQQSLSQAAVAQLGSFLFKEALAGNIPVSKLTFILESSEIPPMQIMMLLATYTQSEECCDILDLTTLYLLHSLVASICSMKGGAEKESVTRSVGMVSSWWQSVRDILSQSVLIGQSLVMAVVCRSVAMELNAATQKIKSSDTDDIESEGWESVTVDIEQWNLLVCRLDDLIDLECFVHENHALTVLSEDGSPTCKHLHKAEGKKEENKGKEKKTTAKSSDRIPVLSVKGLLDAGYGSFSQIVANCVVRQGVPGPCLGFPKLKKALQRKTNTFDSVEETDEDDDKPEQDDNEVHFVLNDLVKIRERFPYSLEQDLVWTHCTWECIMMWNEDVEDVKMLSSALMHLSCIHNPMLQQGLAIMMWKAVFKEGIKQLVQLIEKIGKAPKDRLCKKTVSMGYSALENFLLTAEQLLQILTEVNASDDIKPTFKTEHHWQRTTCTQRSIAEQAVDEPQCNSRLLNHLWCLVASLYLIMLGKMKSIKLNSLFDTKVKHTFNLALHGTLTLSNGIDDAVIKTREQFCCNAISSLVKNHVELTQGDEIARHMTSDLLSQLDIVLTLSIRFNLDEDFVRRFMACTLYSHGLDIAAQEMAMCVQSKAEFCPQILEVIRERLAQSLLLAEGEKLKDNFSKLPTKITIWLQSIDISKLRATSIPLENTYHLLQYLHTNMTNESNENKFIYELIEGLKLFL
ncbi:rab3 GTPase-activating protein non-catalytic subunit-like isoform X2 [Hydractinia symbiolongicarpus]|uniref:rab3 GTPase-activating protein non-catalytic subunit-like isoform X2 n=1 Tax=Hydractinia symbiolongicarpus TaxID=13093 RepID=UPI00254CEAAB|nr:rab3 GTPase-activating protein non-catalytic subunit-like isoform X2 [Hydractinia symbiolongicarpus]XP_057316885.1 rab3 GTPase-activating protein non-catalytic subunit-like isoform X2 [Hydractinia symbiolongicarpus]